MGAQVAPAASGCDRQGAEVRRRGRQLFGWKYGLDRNPARAKQFYGVIVVATLVGMLINFLGINPIDALFWTAVVNGFVAPPVMVLIHACL